MKALFLLIAAASLSGCVAYDPYVYPAHHGASPVIVDQPVYPYGGGYYGGGYYGGAFAPWSGSVAPVIVQPVPFGRPHVQGYRGHPHPGHLPGPRARWGDRDRDGDGIPNRSDPDRDGNGIPNRLEGGHRRGEARMGGPPARPHARPPAAPAATQGAAPAPAAPAARQSRPEGQRAGRNPGRGNRDAQPGAQ